MCWAPGSEPQLLAERLLKFVRLFPFLLLPHLVPPPVAAQSYCGSFAPDEARQNILFIEVWVAYLDLIPADKVIEDRIGLQTFHLPAAHWARIYRAAVDGYQPCLTTDEQERLDQNRAALAIEREELARFLYSDDESSSLAVLPMRPTFMESDSAGDLCVVRSVFCITRDGEQVAARNAPVDECGPLRGDRQAIEAMLRQGQQTIVEARTMGVPTQELEARLGLLQTCF